MSHVVVEFEPAQTVTGRRRERVMVIMPAVAPRQQRDPPVVARLVARAIRLIAEMMGGTIDETGDVNGEDDADEHAPNDPRHAARQQEHETEADLPIDVRAFEEAVERVGREIGGEAQHLVLRRPRVVGLVQPFEMAPAQTTATVVRVRDAIRIGVMPSMGRDPT